MLTDAWKIGLHLLREPRFPRLNAVAELKSRLAFLVVPATRHLVGFPRLNAVAELKYNGYVDAG